MAIIEIPKINSENFYLADTATSNLFHTKHFATDWWQSCLKTYERYNKFYSPQKPEYFIKKQFDDNVTIQLGIPTTATPVLRIYRYNTNVYTTITGTITSTTLSGDIDSLGNPLKKVQYSFNISSYVTDEDYYYFVFYYTIGAVNSELVISEPMWIKQTHEDTILMQYTNSENAFDIAFSLNPVFSIRIDGSLKYKGKPTFNRVFFRNQKTDLRQLQLKVIELYQLIIGIDEGVNDLLVNKIAHAFRCDTILIDNKAFLLSEGAEFEPTPFGSLYPMMTLAIELEQYDNRDSTEVFTSEELVLFPSGGYPYAIGELVLSTSPIPLTGDDYVKAFTGATPYKEVANAAQETAMITALNTIATTTYGRSGNFVIDGGFVKYVNNPAEVSYLGFSAIISDGCLEVGVETTPTTQSITVNVEQNGITGRTVLSCYRDTDLDGDITTNTIAIDEVPMISGTAASGTYQASPPPDYDAFRYFIYFFGINTAISVSSTSDIIKVLDGGTPKDAISVFVDGGDIAAFSDSWLRTSASVIRELSYTNMGLTTFSTSSFTRTLAGDWQGLKNISFGFNELDDTNQDNLYNGYYTNVASFYLGSGVGLKAISTISQTPSSAPTSASATSRTNLTTLAYLIAF